MAAFPVTGFAQDVLTLDDCIGMAVENNRRMAAADWQQSGALYDFRSAKALFLPSFSVTGNALYSTAGGSYSSGMGQLPVFGADGAPTGQFALFPGIDLSYDLGWVFSAGVKVEQPIYMGGKILANYHAADIFREIAALKKRQTETEVIVETSRAYAALVRTVELKKVAESYHDLLSELMRSVESAKKHGMKSQNDVLKVKVKLDESELNLRKAENAGRLAMINLCHCIGKPLTSRVEIDGVLPEVSEPDITGASIDERPEHLMLEQQSELYRQKVAAARSEQLPQVGLVGQYGYLDGVKLNDTKVFGSWNFTVGVQASIPIFDFGRRMNKIKSAKAQYEQSMAEREDTDEMLNLDFQRACNSLDEAMVEKTLSESSVLSAEENLRTSRLQYERGMETLSDYLEAQSLWQNAEQGLVEARINCWLSWLDWRKASGQIR